MTNPVEQPLTTIEAPKPDIIYFDLARIKMDLGNILLFCEIAKSQSPEMKGKAFHGIESIATQMMRRFTRKKKALCKTAEPIKPTRSMQV